MGIFTYKGQEPMITSPQDVTKAVELMLKQLEVLKLMTTQSVFVPAGTQITKQGPDGDE